MIDLRARYPKLPIYARWPWADRADDVTARSCGWHRQLAHDVRRLSRCSLDRRVGYKEVELMLAAVGRDRNG